MRLSARIGLLTVADTARIQMPCSRFFHAVMCLKSARIGAEAGLLGSYTGVYVVCSTVPSAFGPSSTCNPLILFECAVLYANEPSGVVRGRAGPPVDRPVGAAGSAIQKPKPGDPPATLP